MSFRVPTTTQSVGVDVHRGRTSNPDAFGAGVGRAVQGFGNTVNKAGDMGSDIAIKMEKDRVTRLAEDGYNSFVEEAGQFAQDNIFSKKGAETDEWKDPEGFRKHVTGEFDKISARVVEGMDDKARDRYERMIARQRISLEGRAGAHYVRQQEFAARETSKKAVSTATQLGADLVRGSISPGTGGIDSSEWSSVFQEAEAALKVMNSRHGLSNEGAAKDARRGVLKQAVSAMLATGDDESAAMLLEEIRDKYPDDFTDVELAATESSIAKAEKARLEEIDRVAEAEGDQYVEAHLAAYGELPSVKQLKAEGVHPGIIKAVKEAQEEELYYTSALLKIQQFSRNNVEQDHVAMDKAIRYSIANAPPEMRPQLRQLYKDKSTPGSEQIAYAKEQIVALIGDGDKIRGEGGFAKTKWLSEERKGYFLSEVLSEFDQWVNKEPRSDDEIRLWRDNNSKLNSIKGAKSKADVDLVLAEIAPGEYAKLPAYGQLGAQSAYTFSDEITDELYGALDNGTNNPRAFR